MVINEWAKRWGVPFEALRDLQQMAGALSEVPVGIHAARSEAAVQQEVRLAAAKAGKLLWRNNVGVLKDQRGVPVRYGLANDNKALNEKIKSSDLIGISPRVVQPEHVGQVWGLFYAEECKPGGWVYTATEHEQAQLQFINLVLAHGGIARFNNGGNL